LKKIVIRVVQRRDVEGVFALIRELSVHEKELSKLTLTPQKLKDVLFHKQKRVWCIVAQIDQRLVGTALWFRSFYSLRGGWLIFLEDLFVLPRYRGQGVGRRLLRHVAKRAVRERCLGVVWTTRISNKKAVSFYKSLSATQHSDSCHFLLVGKALDDLAKENS
jgi:GNAT superfamily N-acetyltransferase